MAKQESRASMQKLLREAWTVAPEGRLSAWEQAKAWALRQVWRAEKASEWGMVNYIASQLQKAGPHGGQPSHGAMTEFFAKLDADPEWFPGKSRQEQFGPKPVMTAQKKQSVARSAMALKRKGIEPTYKRIIAFCPQGDAEPCNEPARGQEARIRHIPRGLLR